MSNKGSAFKKWDGVNWTTLVDDLQYPGAIGDGSPLSVAAMGFRDSEHILMFSFNPFPQFTYWDGATMSDPMDETTATNSWATSFLSSTIKTPSGPKIIPNNLFSSSASEMRYSTTNGFIYKANQFVTDTLYFHFADSDWPNATDPSVIINNNFSRSTVNYTMGENTTITGIGDVIAWMAEDISDFTISQSYDGSGFFDNNITVTFNSITDSGGINTTTGQAFIRVGGADLSSGVTPSTVTQIYVRVQSAIAGIDTSFPVRLFVAPTTTSAKTFPVHPTGPSVVYTNTQSEYRLYYVDGNVYMTGRLQSAQGFPTSNNIYGRSTDSGDTLFPFYFPYPCYDRAIVKHGSSLFLFETEFNYIQVSTNDGLSWSNDRTRIIVDSIVPSISVINQAGASDGTSLVTLSGINTSTTSTHFYLSGDDGVTWQTIASPFTPGNQISIDVDIIYDNSVNLFIAKEIQGMSYSSDGSTWNQGYTFTGSTRQFSNIFKIGSDFKVADGTTLYSSTDGINWTTSSLPGGVSNSGMTRGATSGTVHILTLVGSPFGLAVASMADFSDAVQNVGPTVPMGLQMDPNTLIWAGTQFLVSDNGGQLYSSTDGTTWV